MASARPRANKAQTARTYKLIELVGTSTQGFEEAIRQAVEDARRTLRGLSWFEVVEQRGRLAPDGTLEFQAKIKVAFVVLGQKGA